MMTKNSMQTDIETFMAACDQEVKKYPGIPSTEVKKLRIRLMTEELLGTTENPAANEFVDEVTLIPSKSDELIQSMINDDLKGVADGIADVLYVVIGTAIAYGINIQEIFDEVQRSNMTKAVWDDVNSEWVVLRREDGKVLKPPTFSEADIEPILQRQIAEGKKNR